MKKTHRIKYLVFDSTERRQRSIKKYAERWEETKRKIEVINDDEPIKYRKDFMKTKFESDDDFYLGKIFNTLDMILVLASLL